MHRMAARLAPLRGMAGGGDFYAGRALAALCPRGGLRVSFVHDTQAQEVDKLISALDQVI